MFTQSHLGAQMNSFESINEFLVKLEFKSVGLVLLSRSVLIIKFKNLRQNMTASFLNDFKISDIDQLILALL